MKKIALIALIATLSISSALAQSIKNMSVSELNTALLKITSNINKNRPVMVDSETRADSSTAINGQLIHYYTLINYTADEVDKSIIENDFAKTQRNKICTTKEMQVFPKNGIPVVFSYYGKNGKYIASFSVLPSHCR